MPSNPRLSEIASIINFCNTLHLEQNGIGGHVTGEAGGYMVSGERYAPDVAYISATRQPEPAVEVISPSDREDKITVKVGNYLAAGVLVWLVRDNDPQVQVYAPG